MQRRRIALERGQYVAPEDIVARALQLSLWPKRRLFLLWREGCYLEIRDKAELQFACRLASEFHMDSIDPINLACTLETEALERQAEARMAEPDSEPDDEAHEDEDITMEDLLAWGCKRMGD